MARYISSITASLLLLACLAGESVAQTTSIKNGNSKTTARVTNTTPASDDPALVIRCIEGCGGGGGGAGTEFSEDAAHSSGALGTLMLGVRRDADTSPVSADNDYHALQFDNAGNLKVNIKAGAGSGGTAMTDDAAFTPGTTTGTPSFFLFDDVSPDSVNEGDGGIGRMSANRNQYVTIRDAAGNERGLNVDASGNITVNVTGTVTVGSHAVTNAGTFATQAAQSGTWTVQPGNTANTTPWLTTISEGGNSAAVNASGQLSITCANCSGSGASHVDDAAFTPATNSGAPAMGLFDDVSPDSVNEGDAGVVRMSANRNLYTTLRDAAGNERGVNVNASNELTTAANTELPAAAALADATANPTVPGVGSFNMCWNGTTWDRCPTGAGGNGTVNASTQRVTIASDSTGNIATIGTSVVPGTGATHLGKAEDAAHTSGDTGIAVLTKRTDAAASSAGTDGDYATLNTDSSGRLWVNCGTGCSGGTQYAEDAAHSSGDTGTLALAVRRDTAASGTSADGDNATLNVDSTGRLWANTELPDAAALADAVSNPTVPSVGSFNMCWNGSTWDRCTKATAGAGAVDSGTQRITWASDAPGIKAEDAAHTTADPGMVILTKRTDTAATSAGTDGDYATLNTDSNGNLWIRCSSGCGAGTQYAEDIAHTTGDQLTMAGAVRRDTATSSSGTDGDVSTINVDASGRLWVNPGTIGVEDAAETAGGNLAMIGTVRRDTAASSAGTTGDNATLNTDANGRLWTITDLSTIGTNAISVGNGASGTGVQRVTIANDSTGILGVNGTVAHDAADAGAPVKIGAVAETALSGITTVADGDVTKLYAGIDGVLIMRPHSNLEDRVSGVAGITDGSSTSVVAAQGAGLRFCATMIVVSNSSATNVTVDIRDGTAGSVLMTIPAAANMGGGVVPLQTPLCTTANTIFAADPSAAASTVAVTAVGFKTKL